uniref:MD-2-related lipid-recognition domain-containing protein n=1 Tax=Anopheles farauti TaxID=69004 RepID=A0A182PZK7_9DIPT
MGVCIMLSGTYGLLITIAFGQIAFAPGANAKFYNVVTYDNCKHMENSAARLSMVKVFGKPDAIELSATLDVVREIEPPVHLQLYVKRCNLQKEACETYEHISMEDVCSKIESNPILHKYMDIFTPPLSCPLKKGRYVAEKSELKLQMLQMFPIENAFWQMEFRFLDKHNQTMQCDFVEIAVTDKQ